MPRKGVHRIESALEHLRGPSVDEEIYPEPASNGSSGHYKKAFAHSSTFVITTHFLKSLFGPSILAMPGGFLKGGSVLSGFGFVAILALVAYNMKRLIINAAHLSQRENQLVRTYDEVVYVSFYTCSERTKRHATAFRLVVNILFFVTYLDSCTIFMIVVAKNVESFLKFNFPESFLTVRYILFLQVVFLMAMSTLRDLKYIAPFSFVGCALLLSSLVMTVVFLLEAEIPSPFNYPHVGSFKTILLFLSTILYCLSGISIALTLKSSMKHPKHFFVVGGVYNLSLTAVCIVFITFGLLGYAKYGDQTSTSLVLNLPENHPLAACAKIFVILSVFLSSPISFYVAFNVIWTNYIKPEMSASNIRCSEHFIRYCLIAFSFLLAMAIPNLAWMVPLKGAIFHSHLEVTIPAILDYVTFYPEEGNGKFRYRQLKAIFIISCGVFFCISGIVACVWDFVDDVI